MSRLLKRNPYRPINGRSSASPGLVVAVVVAVVAGVLAITFIALYATKPTSGPTGEIDPFTQCRHSTAFLEAKEISNEHYRTHFPQSWLRNSGLIIPDRPDLLVKWSRYNPEALAAWNASRENVRTTLSESSIDGISEQERHALYTLGTAGRWYWEDPLTITVDHRRDAFDHMCDYYWYGTRAYGYGAGDPGSFNVIVDLIGLDLGIEYTNNFADSMAEFTAHFQQKSIDDDMVLPHQYVATFAHYCFHAGELDQLDVTLTGAYVPYLAGTVDQQTAAAAAMTRARVELQAFVDLLAPGSPYELKSLALRSDTGSPGLGYGPQEAKDAYARNLRTIGGTTLTAAELHAFGLSETAALHASFIDIVNTWIDPSVSTYLEHVNKIGSNATYAAFFTEIVTVAEYIQEYKNGVTLSRERLSDAFQHFPRVTPEVVAYKGAFAAFWRGDSVIPPDGTGSVIYGTDTLGLPVAQIEAGPLDMAGTVLSYKGFNLALAFHEAYPGHAYQIPIYKELPCSIRPGSSAGSSEGWALYAERVAAFDMGLAYPITAENVFIHLSWIDLRLLRAVRFTVDTGLHDLGWNKQQVVDALINDANLSPASAEEEADRYINWPGQAIGYLAGAIEIEAAREYAETELGVDFDVAVFHDFMIRYYTPDGVIARQRAEYYVELVQAGTLDEVWPPAAPAPERTLNNIQTRSGTHATNYAMKLAEIKYKLQKNKHNMVMGDRITIR